MIPIEPKISKVLIDQIKALKSPFVYISNGCMYALSKNFEFIPFRYTMSIQLEGCIIPSIVCMSTIKDLDVTSLYITDQGILNIASLNLYDPLYNYSLVSLIDTIMKFNNISLTLPVIYTINDLCSDETLSKLVKMKTTEGNEIYYITPHHPINFMSSLIYSNKADIVNLEIRDTSYGTFIADIIVDKKKYLLVTRYHMLKL